MSGESRATHVNEDHDGQPSDNDDDYYEAKLDLELKLVKKMRLALTATLHMFEAARDDMREMGKRMDELRESSQSFRTAFLESKSQKPN